MNTGQPTDLVPDIVGYPDELVEEYHRSGIWAGRTIGQELDLTAEAFGDQIAVAAQDSDPLTYRELDERSDRIALGLHESGLRAGDRVLLQVTSSSLAATAWYGLLKAGIVPIATLPTHREHEIFEIARQAEPAAHLIEPGFKSNDLVAMAAAAAEAQPTLRLVLTIGEGHVPRSVSIEALQETADAHTARSFVEQRQTAVSPDGLAVLQLSGGTTSVPKLIPRLHAEYWYNSRAYAKAVELGVGDCVLHLLPLVHNAGIVCGLHAAHAVGASFAISGFDPAQIKQLLARQTPTHMFMAPPIARMVLDDPELAGALAGALRVVVWTLGKLPLDVREKFETDTCRIQQLYGQGEGLCTVTAADAPREVRFETVGSPISPYDEVRILRPGTEDDVVPGEAGELCCRGPYTIRGYFRGGQRNTEAFTSDGFYRSGDIAVEVPGPAESCYAIEDRLKDVISRGGEKINALEVERLLLQHPAIRAVALVAVPDDRLGERACAVVVPVKDAQQIGVPELAAFLDGLNVAKFKWPEYVVIRDSLPLTGVQKVNKAKLRQEVARELAKPS